MCTGLSVSQSVVVISQVIAASRCNCLQLVIQQTVAVMLTGGRKSVIELIVWVIHLIHFEHLFQAPFIEWAIVRNKRQTLNFRSNLLPDVREYRGVFSILLRKPVYLLTEPLIVFRLRVDQTVERVYNLATAYNHHPHAAHTGTALIGGLEIYCCEIFHNQ